MKKSGTVKPSQTPTINISSGFTPRSMLQTSSIKRIMQHMWIFAFLLLIAAMAFAQDSTKNEKAQLNEDFRKIAEEIKEFYYNGEYDEVINKYKNKCFIDDKVEAGKEKKEFKRVKKKIRANIYQWVALSYFKLDKPGLVDFYLRKLHDKSKTQLNETYIYIAKEIKESYDNGKLNNVIDLYTKYCRKENKGKAEKEKKVFKKVGKEIRADIYQWVVLSYDGLDEPEMRDKYLKKLLDIRHDLGTGNYRPSIKDRGKRLYVVAPRLLLGVKVGTNFTTVHPFKRYSILQSVASTGMESSEKDYFFNLSNSLGFQLGFIIEYAVTKNLSLGTQLSSIDLRFGYKNSFKWEGDGDSITVNFTHRHEFYCIEIPLLLKYRFIKSKLKPYLQIGGFIYFLQFAHKSINTSYTENGVPIPRTQGNLNLKKLITPFNSGFWVGAGVGYDTRVAGLPLRLEIEVNYKHGFNNIVNEDRRYENKELIFGYYDVFDDLKLRNWDLTFKVLLPISFKAFRR